MAVTATFYGNSTRGYLQYTDLQNGDTLVAEPLNVYQVAVASGQAGLASLPADGLWGGPSQFPAQFSGVPGSASPGAFIPGSPGTAHHADRAVLAELEVLAGQRALELRAARERERAERAEEQRLRAAGWNEDELGLRRKGWTAQDIRRLRQRQLMLAQRAAFR
jgi:hypothetical protein